MAVQSFRMERNGMAVQKCPSFVAVRLLSDQRGTVCWLHLPPHRKGGGVQAQPEMQRLWEFQRDMCVSSQVRYLRYTTLVYLLRSSCHKNWRWKLVSGPTFE